MKQAETGNMGQTIRGAWDNRQPVKGSNMGQSNSTIYSSLPNTANDFILSPLEDSDEDEEELFSSANDQLDDELFLTSR